VNKILMNWTNSHIRTGPKGPPGAPGNFGRPGTPGTTGFVLKEKKPTEVRIIFFQGHPENRGPLGRKGSQAGMARLAMPEHRASKRAVVGEGGGRKTVSYCLPLICRPLSSAEDRKWLLNEKKRGFIVLPEINANKYFIIHMYHVFSMLMNKKFALMSIGFIEIHLGS
jgi:hypothetical protein